MKWVLDASVAVRWFLESESDDRAARVLRRLVADPLAFAVPELFAFELFSVLCRVHARPMEAFRDGALPLLQGGMFRQPMTERLAQAAAELSSSGLSGYDACYAALARELRATWLTFDRRAHRLVAPARLSHCLADGMPRGW